MSDCIFCKINAGVIPSDKLYEDSDMFIIKDIDPKAEKHYLAIPKKHFKLLSDMTADDEAMLGRMLNRISLAYTYSRRSKNGFSFAQSVKSFDKARKNMYNT